MNPRVLYQVLSYPFGTNHPDNGYRISCIPPIVISIRIPDMTQDDPLLSGHPHLVRLQISILSGSTRAVAFKIIIGQSLESELPAPHARSRMMEDKVLFSSGKLIHIDLSCLSRPYDVAASYCCTQSNTNEKISRTPISLPQPPISS